MSMIDKEFEAKCKKAECRACDQTGLVPVLDLGMMPLSDGMLTASQLIGPEPSYPLQVACCEQCSLLQILETVPPEKLFCEDYPYYSSFCEELLVHSRKNALSLIKKRKLDESSFVVEIASNDGYLLKNFIEAGISVLGIDPSEGPVKAAEKIGVNTLNTFFSNKLAHILKKKGRMADVIIANNVLAHVADTNGFVEGIATLLKDDGVAVIEVPYVCELIENCQFDTIYHEHLCYFSVTALDNLFRSHNLFLNDIERLEIHGGSLRLYIEHHENASDIVKDMLADEKQQGVDTPEYYKDFSLRVRITRQKIQQLLSELKWHGKKVAAYGAAAKGTIMLNYIGAGPETIDYVVDRNIHKQGKYMPGIRLPICEPERIVEEMPDYVMILPWNFKDEIMSQQHEYHEKGGKFIVPIPEPQIV
jgi:SAM-dependent methyltransferase